MPDEIDRQRRRLFGAAAVTIAAAQLANIGAAQAQASATEQPAARRTDKQRLRPAEADRRRPAERRIRRGRAGRRARRRSCCTAGPTTSHSFVDVTPMLAAQRLPGDRPLSAGLRDDAFPARADTFRNGQPSAVALDIIALMDALKIETASLAGFDWGARTADIIAALWPQRCQEPGLGERLSDRQPGLRRNAAAAGGRVRSGGTSSTSPPTAARRATTRTGTTSPS